MRRLRFSRLRLPFLALALGAGLATPAAAAELVMFEAAGCPYCARWNREIGLVYPKTDEGRRAPLRRVDIAAPRPADLAGIAGIVYTPTFVLMEDGREIGRIVGYSGDDVFWSLLAELLRTLDRIEDRRRAALPAFARWNQTILARRPSEKPEQRNMIRLSVTALLATLTAAPALAQDAEKGKSQFGQCRACHSLDAGKNGVGPSLHGLFGRTAGTVEKYSYSSDMKAAGEKGLKWDEASVFEYLADPGAFLKKYLAKDSVSNKMPNKFPSEELRKNIIAYLKDATK